MTRLSRTLANWTSRLSKKKSKPSPPPNQELDLDLDTRLIILILRRLKQMSVELDALTANVAKLATDVDTLIAKASTGVPAAAVQAQADAVAAIDAKVVAVP